jgi:hypothetical protein
MQDEELDKLINDAANQHHPPYNDTSWGKMEHLLDKHLPQKKDRRKFIFWLFLFLLSGSGVTLGILQPWKKTATETTIAKNAIENKPGNTNAQNFTAPVDNKLNNPLAKQNTGTIAQTANDNNSNGTINDKTANAPLAKQNTIAQTVTDNTGKKILPNAKPETAQAYMQKIADIKSNSYKTKSRSLIKVKKPLTAPGIENDVTIQKTGTEKNNDTDNTNPLSDKEKQNAVVVNKIAVDKMDVITAGADRANKINEEKTELVKKAPAQQKQKTDKSFASNFAFTVSAGADVAYVSINNTGKVKSFYGAGARYNLGKHFTVSSGLFVSRKIYTAAPDQYKFPTGGSTRPNLVQINADCKIYEIPLWVYYNFKPVKNNNWFGGIGISSFIMKKESYDYQYKAPNGQTWNYGREVNNENEHYFSVLTLSGGYQYKINNRISFIAEPYIKLPLKGIGYGTVKLNSAGVLFTAAVKPFAKKK